MCAMWGAGVGRQRGRQAAPRGRQESPAVSVSEARRTSAESTCSSA